MARRAGWWLRVGLRRKRGCVEMGCLYRLTFPNGKIYVGWTSLTARQRLEGHKLDARSNSDHLVHKAIRKFGEGSICIDTLVIADDCEYLKQLERLAIKVFHSKMPQGYNMTDGGEGVKGLKWSIESRERAKIQRKGRVFCPASTARLPEINRGRKRSSELEARMKLINSDPRWRAKMSVVNATMWALRLGRPLSLLMKL